MRISAILAFIGCIKTNFTMQIERKGMKTALISKKINQFLKLVFLLFMVSILSFSCNRGTGCPINEGVHVKPNKKGQYPTSKTRSGLFPKDMKKKTKVN